MTELEELEITDLAPIEEAVALIDKGLGGLTERNLVSACLLYTSPSPRDS